MTATTLFTDTFDGTKVTFDGKDTVKVEVAYAPFSKCSAVLDLDDVDRLLAVREHAVDPALDIADFFNECTTLLAAPRGAQVRAAQAFVACAGSLAEIVYG